MIFKVVSKEGIVVGDILTLEMRWDFQGAETKQEVQWVITYINDDTNDIEMVAF